MSIFKKPEICQQRIHLQGRFEKGISDKIRYAKKVEALNNKELHGRMKGKSCRF